MDSAHEACKNESDAINNTGAPLPLSILFRKYLKDIPAKHKIKGLRKTAILGTAHVLRKVLMYRYKTFSTGHNGMRDAKCSHRIAVTLYTVQTWFVSGL